jgi:hypothetical protein
MNLEQSPTFDPEKAKRLLEEAEFFTKNRTAGGRLDPVSAFEIEKQRLKEALATLPEKVEIPYDKTPEGERAAQFKRVCPEEFYVEVDFLKVRSRRGYDSMLAWDGSFPGPCAVGDTRIGKTFAAWQAIRNLYVKKNMTFAWFPVRRMVTELERYEKAGVADDFFRTYDLHRLLFVDDFDKINWDYESHSQMLFAFLDWIYRANKPCIITTNRNRAWWKEKTGDAFVRRLFVDGCREIEFK